MDIENAINNSGSVHVKNPEENRNDRNIST